MSLQAESSSEQARLASLYQYEILDSGAEEIFDEITRFTSRLFQVPTAFIALVDSNRVWFKSKTGLNEDEQKRDSAFCAYAIEDPEKVLIVPDALNDPRYASLHLVTSEPKYRFYAGAPLVTQRGHVLGTLSILDKTPRIFDRENTSLLQNLAKQVMGLLDLRLRERQLSENMSQTVLALEQSEKFYELVGRFVSDAVWDWDLIQDKVRRSEGLKKNFGYSPNEMENDGQGWKVRIHPDDHERVWQGLVELIRGNSDYWEDAYRFLRSDNTYAFVEDRGTVIRDASGKGIRMIGAMVDVTGRRMVADVIRRSEEKYRTLFEESPDVVFICSPDGSFLEINATGVQFLGAEKKEILLGRKLDDLCWDAEVRSRHQNAIKSQGFLKDYELTLKSLTGDKLHVLETCKALYENDRIVGYRGILRDITHVRRLQEQLFQVQKIEAIGQLAGGVAHDFNNILMAITGFAELALWKLEAENPLRETLAEILKSAEQGASLTQQLLAFSRRQIMQPKIIDLNKILRSMGNFLKLLIGADFELNTVLDEAIGSIQADPSKVEQVILNLAVNARDAMPEGGRLVIETSNTEMDEEYISHHAGSRVGRYVMLTVSDTGTGMSEATMARIFEPFFTTKEQGKGTGLGLSTVYGIVKQSDGYITVYSEPGRGTTFRVYFPRIDGEKEAPKGASAAQEAPVTGTETILIVDDNEPVRSSIGALLEMHGYKVLQAGNGPESIELLRQHSGPVHLMITDIVMPTMSGLALAHSLRELRPNLRVLCMSGYSREAFERQGRIESGTDFLNKPVSMSVLLAKVREILDRSY